MVSILFEKIHSVSTEENFMIDFKINTVYQGFKLIDAQYIGELQGIARYFIHEKSGAKLVQLGVSDTNKTFTISFKTPPSDNSGVAHIIEHAVCCASKKYPLKDTFIEMDKGSLNTGLNACTYKDMTMYYAASENPKDLLNLMTVYMDLVFNPLIYERSYIFKQEGWHYTLEDREDDIGYNGIVYNEMQGEYTEPMTILEHEINTALFPQSIYRYDSGGLPEEIVNLTEEKFLNFHRDYYHPSNCTICLYGDGELLDQLELLDKEYLRYFEKKEQTIDIMMQSCFEQPSSIEKKYPLDSDESPKDKGIIALSFVVDKTLNTELRLAFQVLEHMLLKSSASPLTESIVREHELGKTIEEGGYDTGKLQPTFSIILSGTDIKHSKTFEKEVLRILHQLAYEGIDKNLLEASLNTITFALQESASPWEPKGVLYSEEIQNSLLYGGNPFEHLKYQKHIDYINAHKEHGYFEELIKTYFLENTHRVLISLDPCKKLYKMKEKEQKKRLRAYKKSLTPSDIEALINLNLQLDDIQEACNTTEELALLPTLTLEDISPVAKQLYVEEDAINNIPIIRHHESTKDVIYMHFLFDTRNIREEDIPYIGLLTNLLTYISTKNYSYTDLENEINKQTGGLNCATNAYTLWNDTDCYSPYFKISSKVLIDKLPSLIQLIEEITIHTVFNEKAKIKEILGYIKYEMERSFVGSSEYIATKRIYSSLSAAAMYENLISGISYYEFLSELYERFDEKYSELTKKLQQVYHQIMQRGNLLISVSAEPRYTKVINEHLAHLIKSLPEHNQIKYAYELTPKITHEGYLVSTNVQSVAKGFNYRKLGYEFDGALYVVNNILDSTYLWDKVRLQGGAYGCELSIGRDGNVVMCSSCDPELTKTLETYNGISEFLRNIELNQEELLKYIIGTIGGMDIPLTMEQKSEKALTYYLCGISHETIQLTRSQIIKTTLEDIRRLAYLFEESKSSHAVCVIGNSNKLNKNKDLFDFIKSLK